MLLLQRPFVAALFVAAACLASPTPLAPLEVTVLRPDQTDALVREGVNLAHTSNLERRLEADFSLAHTWNDKVLFHIDHTWKQEDSNETTALSIVCLDCETKGSVTAKLRENLFHPTLRLEFNEVEAYILVGLNASASTTVSVNLFSTNTPIGLHFPGLSAGVVFFVDLVFSLTAELDLQGGFYFKMATDAFLEAGLFDSEVSDFFFDGMSTKSLPIMVGTASGATFKADLRLRVQAGVEAGVDTGLDLFGMGAGAAIGIFANLVEFVAEIEQTPTCALETKEWFDLNAAAYAKLDVVVNYKTLGPVPTVSTTLLSAPTFTQCWLQPGQSPPAFNGAALRNHRLYMTSSALPMMTSTSSALPMISSSALPASHGSHGSHAIVSGPQTTSNSSRVPTSTFMPRPLTTAMPSVALPPFFNGTGRYPIVNGSSLVTSTLYSTEAFTVTMCAAQGVINCPQAYQSELAVTRTVDVYTTVCPAGAQVTWPAAVTDGKPVPSSSSAAATSRPVVTQVIVLTAIPSPTPETFVPPVPASTMPALAVAATVPDVSQPAVVDASAATPTTSGSDDHRGPVATGATKPTENSIPLTPTKETPVTAGGVASYAGNLVLVLGSLVATMVMLG